MPKKGSHKVQFEVQSILVEPKPEGGWRMRVVLDGDMGNFPAKDSQVAGAIEEAKAQTPNVVVSSATVKEITTEMVEPGQTGTVPKDSVTQAPDTETVQEAGDASDSTWGLPFAPERKPDAEAVHKRVRRAQGKEQ